MRRQTGILWDESEHPHAYKGVVPQIEIRWSRPHDAHEFPKRRVVRFQRLRERLARWLAPWLRA